MLAAVLGAVELGYRVVLATDALCSSSDEAHDASMAVYRNRFGQQIETVPTEPILDGWHPRSRNARRVRPSLAD